MLYAAPCVSTGRVPASLRAWGAASVPSCARLGGDLPGTLPDRPPTRLPAGDDDVLPAGEARGGMGAAVAAGALEAADAAAAAAPLPPAGAAGGVAILAQSRRRSARSMTSLGLLSRACQPVCGGLRMRAGRAAMRAAQRAPAGDAVSRAVVAGRALDAPR